MSFGENIKLQVKRNSHFCCCICHSVGVEIHHIIPQSEGGDDSAENAAPLCPSCHETYGANPQKRKFIRETKDLWYELCSKQYEPAGESLQDIRELIKQSHREIVGLRTEIMSVLESPEDCDNMRNIGVTGVVQHILSKYSHDKFPWVFF